MLPADEVMPGQHPNFSPGIFDAKTGDPVFRRKKRIPAVSLRGTAAFNYITQAHRQILMLVDCCGLTCWLSMNRALRPMAACRARDWHSSMNRCRWMRWIVSHARRLHSSNRWACGRDVSADVFAGSSHYKGDIYLSLATQWVSRVDADETVVSETTLPMPPNKVNAIIERTILIRNVK